MDKSIQQLRNIITNECLLMNIEYPHIAAGCTHAEDIYERSKSLVTGVRTGIAMAKLKQKEFNAKRWEEFLNL